MAPWRENILLCAALLLGVLFSGCRTEEPPQLAYPIDRGLLKTESPAAPAVAGPATDPEVAAAVKALRLPPTPGDREAVARLFSTARPDPDPADQAATDRARLQPPSDVEVYDYDEWDPWFDYGWRTGPSLRADAEFAPGANGQRANGPFQFRVGVRDDPRDFSTSGHWRVLEWSPGRN